MNFDFDFVPSDPIILCIYMLTLFCVSVFCVLVSLILILASDMGVGVLDSLVSDAGGDYQAILMENQSLSRIYLK